MKKATVPTSTTTAGMWRLGALLELPRDMHCAHELRERGAGPGDEPCPDCRRVLEVMEALRKARPA